jgi:hypothetical protein
MSVCTVLRRAESKQNIRRYGTGLRDLVQDQAQKANGPKSPRLEETIDASSSRGKVQIRTG